MDTNNFFSGYNKSTIDDIVYFVEMEAGKKYAKKELLMNSDVSLIDLSSFENEPAREAFYKAFNNTIADTFCHSTALLSFIVDYKFSGLWTYLNFIEKLTEGTVFLYMRNESEHLLQIDLNYVENFGLYDMDVSSGEVFAWSHDGEDGIIYVSASEYVNYLRDTAEKELERKGISRSTKEKAVYVFDIIESQEYEYAFSLMSTVDDLDFLYKLSTKKVRE